MKLELKHLAPYLPYGLNGMIDGKRVVFHSDNIWVFTLNAKPILRPLSDLSKDMLSKYYKHLMADDLDKIIEDTIAWPLNQSYTFTQKLLEWHFDIFWLIEKNLAIDINTIKCTKSTK